MTNLNQLPSDLPIPQDDGAAKHLVGMCLPTISLNTTTGKRFNLGELKGRLVIYCYPMTGQPNVALPDGWDQMPGARGCTPQSCSFRDHYQELRSLGADVVGLSVQHTEYQQEMADRLHLPFAVLSDVDYQFQQALQLPTFVAAGMTLLKRITLVANDGVIEAVHYPIFPSDSDPAWVIDYLKNNPV
ncbi:MAG: peroxiredoxin [Polynucleobacter sp. 24-46-87]|jgi:peroxiredoxin|uniref:peroxiredoxin n=1 Tax=unclassified Polynucleobacter TaxID=2640945 RepID=UPI000BD017D2|nr:MULTISPECIES: peroxiredoxin [unclassified Polynucleobacter]OYY12489.1 MAG: peroxiredoxin [Polynucleobacter sp. 35-46-11]OZA14769.1 MAG: peroxiredoxin [Polynucleobacter sp. 24-46-87]OZA76402.1 MAG: peroxiredoxin [Polynucleobacter sp. 39-46-10]